MSAKPPVVVDLTWGDGLQFLARLSKSELVIDSAGVAGPSPVEALTMALAGCTSVDVTHILKRGRHPIRSLPG